MTSILSVLTVRFDSAHRSVCCHSSHARKQLERKGIDNGRWWPNTHIPATSGSYKLLFHRKHFDSRIESLDLLTSHRHRIAVRLFLSSLCSVPTIFVPCFSSLYAQDYWDVGLLFLAKQTNRIIQIIHLEPPRPMNHALHTAAWLKSNTTNTKFLHWNRINKFKPHKLWLQNWLECMVRETSSPETFLYACTVFVTGVGKLAEAMSSMWKGYRAFRGLPYQQVTAERDRIE